MIFLLLYEDEFLKRKEKKKKKKSCVSERQMFDPPSLKIFPSRESSQIGARREPYVAHFLGSGYLRIFFLYFFGLPLESCCEACQDFFFLYAVTRLRPT